MKKLTQKLTAVSLVSTALVASTAHAAVDTANIVTELTSNQASIAAVGGAALMLFAAAVVFRYIKKAF